MIQMISISNSDFETMLFCAVRYALGRKTYVVNSIVGTIHQQWTNITERTLEQIAREILEYKDTHKVLGHQCDERDWMSIVQRWREENLA